MSIIEQNRYTKLNLNNIEENCYLEFEAKVESLNEHIINIIENGFKDKKFNSNDNVLQNNDEELKVLVEQNKQLRYSIDTKLNEISQQKNQYENYKKDQKLLSQEIKETHEAFLMAKKYYKKFLKIYYTIESKSEGSQTIFIQFFTEAKKESENYSVRLVRNTNTGCYQLSTVKPKLKAFEELNNKLLETNDVPGALCCIRQAFLKAKMYKK
uniref:Kinetochore protein SPC25 n=1 Tax=Heliothis virescens TaxID=7102 RepID=A0A2A4JS26_HELVI